MKFLLIAGLAESLINFRGPLISALQSHGLEVHAAAPFGAAEPHTRAQLESRGVVVHDIPLQRTGLNPFADLRALWVLTKIVFSVRPTFVLGYTIKPVIYGAIAAWLGKVPGRFALITGLGYTFQGERNRRLVGVLSSLLYKAALSTVHGVIFQNPDDEQLFREIGLVSDKKRTFVVNGSGVDLAGYPVAGLPPSLHFLLIARLLGDKGIREYVSAGLRIKELHPDVTVSLLGPYDTNPDAIRAAEVEDWVSKGIRYLGSTSDVRPAIAACSVYVLPSYREGTPRTVLEAMSMGRAVITTDAPGCRETVVDGHNGFLVKVKSVDEVEVAMQKFIRNPELVTTLGQRARKFVEEKFDVEKVNASMLSAMGIR